jgi:hypothetical protein
MTLQVGEEEKVRHQETQEPSFFNPHHLNYWNTDLRTDGYAPTNIPRSATRTPARHSEGYVF